MQRIGIYPSLIFFFSSSKFYIYFLYSLFKLKEKGNNNQKENQIIKQ